MTPALAALLDHHPTPVLTWDREGLWPLRDWAEATTGKLVLFGRMERLAGQLTHARQGERVVAWRERPFQNCAFTEGLAEVRYLSSAENTLSLLDLGAERIAFGPLIVSSPIAHPQSLADKAIFL